MGIPGAAPARLGRYELIARLATGGMGEIFLARMEGAAGFEKLFVIKRILPHLADDVRFRDMLIAEARIASMMTHANICQVYELGETDGQLYIVMEYLEGITVLPLLRKLSKEAARLDLGFVGGVLQQVTDGLHYAHELKDRGGEYLGIVHRDVTPSNLFLTDSGVVKVLDFGIAKVKDATAHTQTGTVKGKYAYMSPEQLRGAAVDRRSDVFALGVVVYEMLALRRLFQRKTDYLTFRAVMEQPIVDIRHYRPDCPDPLAAVLARALDRDPANRFDSSRQLGSAVLDAITAIKRPWTQGEISDFVTGHFADEIRKRSVQIASVVHSGVARQTMPLLARPDDPEIEIEDDYEFPEVDSAIAGTPADGRRVLAPGGGAPTALGPAAVQARRPTGDQPASFYEPTGPQLEPLRGAPAGIVPASPVVVTPRRSLVWPLLAIAMVAVAGGALVLVWQQTQHQAPTSVVITNSADGRARDVGSNVIVLGADPIEPGVDPAAPAQPTPDPPGGVPPRPAEPRRKPIDPYFGVVRAKRLEANHCVAEHGNPPPGTRVLIVVAPDGHPRNVTVKPVSVDATPLATCIKGVFRGATFPRGDRDHELEVKLVPPV
jgi:eukaryotic-like serine/threonine-protein kinase